jgi:outer membrane protein OmpA-like peptidoglycan-associated protein
MSHCRNTGRVLFAAIAVGIIVSLSCALSAQETPKSELFIGYQWLNPGGTVPEAFQSPNAPVGIKPPSMGKGFGSSYTYNFTKILGLEGDFGHNWNDFGYETTLSVGPKLTWRQENVNLFIHGLMGYNRFVENGIDPRNGFGLIGGGGMDLKVIKQLSIRVFEADYVWAQHHFDDVVAPAFNDLQRPTLRGARLRTGFVFNFGGAPEAVPVANCSVQPSEVMVGEPITATVSTSNFNPKHALTYAWSGNGGKVTGNNTTASIDTNGVAGGNYTVTAHVTDPKTKHNGEASCSANYTVKEPPKNPPTLSLSASPTSVQAGTPSSITANCTSPDNVPVTVSGWTATGGSVSGSGNTATLTTSGASPGPITVSATCTDSRGLTAPATNAQVTVEKPPLPEVNKEVEARLALGHSIYFPTAQPTVQKPDGGLLASQEQTLSQLADDFKEYLKARPDAHLILEGHADRRGSVEYNEALSQRRVDRTKNYLVEHGVPADHIDTKALGKQHNLTDAEVKESIAGNPTITAEERKRILRNELTIILASNRRVDVTLSTTGQTSVKQFPFNAADSLTLIGGREKPKAAPAAKKPAAKKAPAKKK